MPLRAVIFDRDGVLVTVDRARAVAFLRPLVPLPLEEVGARWHQFGLAQGFPRTVEEEHRFWRRFWSELSDEYHLDQAVRAQLLDFRYTSVMTAFPDARPALLEVRRRGLRAAVLSNFSLASLDDSLEAAGLRDVIDIVVSAHVLGVVKPAAEAYRAVSAALEVEPAECLFLDDRQEHVAGARLLGMHAYLVDRQQPHHRFTDGIIRDLFALPMLLNQHA